MSGRTKRMVNKSGNEKGFTLIELIIVIVILGILSVVAIPKYQDIRTEANIAAAEGVYGAAQGAAAVNFAARLVSPTIATTITDASSLSSAMDGGAPSPWVVGAGNTISNTVGATVYAIGVSTAETATNKAVIVKSGF